MKSRTLRDEEVKLSITPLIDVTFLLLIFFMCAMKFKTLERKLSAHLPKKMGLSREPIKLPPETRISVLLTREAGETATRVKFVDSFIGVGDPGFLELGRRIAAAHSRDPEMPGEIDAAGEVPHREVIRVLDEFQEVGVSNVVFRGTAPKRR